MKYRSSAELSGHIDAYFDHCRGHILCDGEGQPVRDRLGLPIMVDAEPPTVTGLALWLGLSGRQALLNYQDRPAFAELIERAKARCEAYCEKRLFDREGANGAKFALENNYGWRRSDEDGGGVSQQTYQSVMEEAKLRFKLAEAERRLAAMEEGGEATMLPTLDDTAGQRVGGTEAASDAEQFPSLP